MVSPGRVLGGLVTLAVLIAACSAAVYIRLNAVFKYGRVIHEFDPWFNFRSTEYLVRNGHYAFQNWFDAQSWYPIGRHVGSTIYPGMMYTSAFIFYALQLVGLNVSLNDVCVFLPPAFSILSVLFSFLLGAEVTGSESAGVAAACFMSILPAHLMRSVAGGYDNECIAMAAMIVTFYTWVRSVRDQSSWRWGAVCGIAYIYMVAAWGGYIFVLNMIGLHAAAMVLLGRFSHGLHRAYSLFFVIGTLGALQFPIVGWQPLQSMEQVGPLLVFLGLQVLEVLQVRREREKMSDRQFLVFCIKWISVLLVAAALFVAFVLPEGWLGPLSARVRGLLIKHTKTGNPLVDSVAEHQATHPSYYAMYFSDIYYVGWTGCLIALLASGRTNAKLFGVLFCVVTGFFSQKMIRLMLLLAPAASIMAAYVVGGAIDFALLAFFGDAEITAANAAAKAAAKAAPAPSAASSDRASRSSQPKRATKKSAAGADNRERPINVLASVFTSDLRRRLIVAAPRLSQALALALVAVMATRARPFVEHCFQMSHHFSEPQIMAQAHTQSGEVKILDDFREGYWWLRDNTPADSRIMAWWDYGYQINGIANRTTIADGNTWNHEHIAMLARILISEDKEAHRSAVHLADYVLVWSTRFVGLQADDLAKMPHLCRIAASVFSDVQADTYYMDQNGQPSPATANSLLFKLIAHRYMPNVPKPIGFEEVHTTPNAMMRIWKVQGVNQKSKEYGYTHHDYPPALKRGLLKKQVAFRDHKQKGSQMNSVL